MTPIEIIDQMIEELPDDSSWRIALCETVLKEARERIMNECSVLMYDNDNSFSNIPYNIPFIILDSFKEENEKFNWLWREWREKWRNYMDEKFWEFYA